MAPGSYFTPAPQCRRGCQSVTTPPVESLMMAMRPASNTSNGAMITFPPSSLTRPAVASTSSAVRCTFQHGGMPICRCSCCWLKTAAA